MSDTLFATSPPDLVEMFANSSDSDRGQPGTPFAPDQLLQHVPAYSIVICRACRFAVQPSALSSHLQRHHILRSERRRILDQLSTLALASPEHVPAPPPSSPAFQGIPVYAGHRCNAIRCIYSCVSLKRMSQHWSEQHGQPNSQRIAFRSAKLQTFFRGTKIRYFEVLCPAEHLSQALHDHANNAERRASAVSLDSRSMRGRHAASTPIEQTIGDDACVAEASPTSQQHLDLDALMYMHSYLIASGPQLSRGTEPVDFWTHTIPQEAARYEFLMCGLLATAAFHSALCAAGSDSLSAYSHQQAALAYQSRGIAGFRAAMTGPSTSNSTALIAFGRMIGVQNCVQAQLQLDTPGAGTPDFNMSRLVEFLVLMRGGSDLLLALQSLLPVGSAFILPEDVERGLCCLRQDFPSAFLDDGSGISNLPSATASCASATSSSSSTLDWRMPSSFNKCSGPAASQNDAHSSLPPQVNSLIATLPARLHRAFTLSNSTMSTITQSIHALRDAVALVYAAHTSSPWPLWNGVEGWIRCPIVQGHNGLLSLMEDREPAALVVFGYWCALLIRQLEGRYWFMKGLTGRLLRVTVRATGNKLVSEMLSEYM